jgi:5-methylcytosine-specific restriction endonuclease McrA
MHPTVSRKKKYVTHLIIKWLMAHNITPLQANRHHGGYVRLSKQFLKVLPIEEFNKLDPKLMQSSRPTALLHYLNDWDDSNNPRIGRQKPSKRSKHDKYITLTGNAFYDSDEWKRFRYQILRHYGAVCMCCGATPADGKKMHVDHIKPRSKYPDLALDLNNGQVLCEDCNIGKGNSDEIDYRPKDNLIPTRI